MREYRISERVRVFLKNLLLPGMLSSKIRLVIKNNFIKVNRLRGCCGFHGEPGC